MTSWQPSTLTSSSSNNSRRLPLHASTLHLLLLPLCLLFLLHLIYPLLTYHIPDEYFQSLEPLHRVSYGYSIETWEWLRGLRSYCSVLLYLGVYWGLRGILYVITMNHFDLIAGGMSGNGFFVKFMGSLVAVVSLYFAVEMWNCRGGAAARMDSLNTKRQQDADDSGSVNYSLHQQQDHYANGKQKTTPLSENSISSGSSSPLMTTIQTHLPWFLSALTGYWIYCTRRPITNSLEMMFTAIALYYYWRMRSASTSVVASGATTMGSYRSIEYYWYWFYAGVGCLSRPTNAVLHIYVLFHMLFIRRGFTWRDRFTFLQAAAVLTLFWLLFMTIVDRIFYGCWVFSMIEFLKFNLLEGNANLYGVLPWHWYFSQGFPLLLLSYLIPFLYMNYRVIVSFSQQRKQLMMGSHHQPTFSQVSESTLPRISFELGLVWWTIFCFSFLPHKEFRFLLPIYPQALNIAMKGIQELLSLYDKSVMRKKALFWIGLMLIPQLIFGLYFCIVHQRGSVEVMHFLTKRYQQVGASKMDSVYILMPCHHTPGYFFLHSTDAAPPSLRLRLLDCSPPGMESSLTREPDHSNRTLSSGEYLDETDLFYAEPEEFVNRMFSHAIPSHVVLYKDMAQRVAPLLESQYYFRKVASIRNMYMSHIWGDSRLSSHIEVFER